MEIMTSIILGALQGLTEFLPVSSSGHLVLAEKLLGGKATTGLIFEVLVHFATMVAILIYFRKKIGRLLLSLFPPYTQDKYPLLKLAGIILIGTIPAVVIGLAFKDNIEQAFNSTKMVSLMLLITAVMLLMTRLARSKNLSVGPATGLLIGVAQSMALLPGISRSGATISTGLCLKIAPAEAAEFSFLLSLPAVFGATILKSFELTSTPLASGVFGAYLLGAITAFVVGYISIAWLMRIIKKGKFFYFGIYCFGLGITGLIFL